MHIKFAFEGAPSWCQKPHTNQALSRKLIHLLCQRDKLHCLKTIWLHTALTILSLTSIFPRNLQADYSFPSPPGKRSRPRCFSRGHWQNKALEQLGSLPFTCSLPISTPVSVLRHCTHGRPHACGGHIGLTLAHRATARHGRPRPPGPPRPLASDSPPDPACQSICAPPWGAESWRQ